MKDVVDNTIVLTAVPAAVVDVVWPDVAPMLKRATDRSRNRYTVEDIYRNLEIGVLGLWLAMDDSTPIAAITTRIENFPTGVRALTIDWIGGSRMADWMPEAQKVLVDYAKANGCTVLQSHGRKGWLRPLEKQGWELDYTAYRLEIDNG